MADEHVPCYVARKPDCGCIVAATVDEPDNDEWRKMNAKEIARWLRKGYVVDRVTVGYVRANFQGMDCPHVQPKPKQQQLFEGE